MDFGEIGQRTCAESLGFSVLKSATRHDLAGRRLGGLGVLRSAVESRCKIYAPANFAAYSDCNQTPSI